MNILKHWLRWLPSFLLLLPCYCDAVQRNDTLFLPNPFGDTMRELDDALEAVFLSSLVRGLDESSLDKVPSPYNPLLWWDSGSTDVLFVTNTQSGRIHVAFRGTDMTFDGDWSTDFDLVQGLFGPPEAPSVQGVIYDYYSQFSGQLQAWNIQVHKGFNTALFSQSFYDVATEILLNYDTIWITGHSLGGAEAQLFGTYLAFRHPELNIYVTTFGSPRVGNYGFKVWANSLKNLNVWRFVNRRDVVPRGPVNLYEHAGHIMWKEPCEEENCDGPVVAYYRQTGDSTQGYDDIGSVGFASCKYNESVITTCISQRSLSHSNARPWMHPFIASRGNGTFVDHLITGYIEWMEYAKLDPTTNYTCSFEGASDTQCSRSEIAGSGAWLPPVGLSMFIVFPLAMFWLHFVLCVTWTSSLIS